ELCGEATYAAIGGAHREEVHQAGEYQLGFAPALVAACVRYAFAGGWSGFAGDSGVAGAPVAVDDPEIYARVDSAIDGDLRQGASARIDSQTSEQKRGLLELR